MPCLKILEINKKIIRCMFVRCL